MSPLGPLSVFPLLQPRHPIIDPNYFSSGVTNEGGFSSDQLLRFMSVSLVKESSAVSLHHHQQQRRADLQVNHHHLLTLGKSRNRMTLKMDHAHELGQGQGNQVKNGAKTLLHGIRNFINPETEERRTAGSVVDDEVGRIGDEGEDGRRSPAKGPPGDDTDVEIDVDDSMSTVTTTTGSHSPSPSSSTSVRSPTPENNSIDPTNFRLRNYSSEDSLSMKPPLYNPLNSLSEAFINSSFQRQEEQRQHQASLFFSIANILRPDFGLGRLPGLLPGSIPPPPPPIGFLNHFNNKQPLQQRPPTKRTKSGFLPDDLPQVKKLKLGKNEPVIPIDLSRSTTTALESPPRKASSNGTNHNSTGHKSAKHHRISSSNKTPWSSSSFPIPTQGKNKSPEGKNGSFPPLPPPPERTKSSSCDDKEKNWPPAWVYCTRYSDRPSSGPRTRRTRKQKEKEVDEKRPRTAFTAEQLSRLKKEFDENQYLNEPRRQALANDLQLHENQIKIWFQNKRAKLKKSSGKRGPLAQQLEEQGLYNHSTIPPRGHEDEDSDMEDE